MRWAKLTTITVSSLLLLYVLTWSAGYTMLYERVEPVFIKFVILFALYITLFVVLVRAIAKSKRAKLAYLLFGQYVLCLAAVSVLQDIFRGWYAWVRGYTYISLGWYEVREDPEFLYDDIGLLYAVRVPVPEWNWSLLLGISVLLVVLAIGWFVKTIRRN
ncbi:hypothetical protein [Paenibacillus kobensis]|uniref:hypothetical protein n=1 Tax=Paenibacillus kobensis TaxID=59841 RepID=UPI000FD7B4D1|nr:hypothetical protein [Paenibacillus kobensis]